MTTAGRRVGAEEFRARLEIGHPDVAEDLADVVEDLRSSPSAIIPSSSSAARGPSSPP